MLKSLIKNLGLGVLWLITLPFWIFLLAFSYRMLYLLARPIMRFLFRIKIKGQENLPKEENYLVIARHKSGWDILAMGLAIGRPMRWVAREKIGLGILKKYTISIDPERPKLESLRKIYQALEKGEIIGIFPEGSRVLAKQKLNPGVIHFAEKTQKKIVPLTILAKGPMLWAKSGGGIIFSARQSWR